ELTRRPRAELRPGAGFPVWIISTGAFSRIPPRFLPLHNCRGSVRSRSFRTATVRERRENAQRLRTAIRERISDPSQIGYSGNLFPFEYTVVLPGGFMRSKGSFAIAFCLVLSQTAFAQRGGPQGAR